MLFDNVAYIDASINSLSLGDYTSCRFTFNKILCLWQKDVTFCFPTASFSSFVSLRKLNLSLNGLCNMTFQAADFPHLEVRTLTLTYLLDTLVLLLFLILYIWIIDTSQE